MKLKKKVKSTIIEYGDRESYERHALICPICGQNIMADQSSRIFSDRIGEYDWLYKITAKKIVCNCPDCGCQWKVKAFRGIKNYAKS